MSTKDEELVRNENLWQYVEVEAMGRVWKMERWREGEQKRERVMKRVKSDKSDSFGSAMKERNE